MTLGCGAAAQAGQVLPPVPTVSVPVDPGTHAYDSAAYLKNPQNLAAVGYSENEYFISGQAHVYQFTNPLAVNNNAISALPGGAVPYTHRVLVRAPTDPTRFSGNVIVEILNDALAGDNVTQWVFANSEFTKNGDIWIGMTSTPAGARALRKFSPSRYANASSGYGQITLPVLPASSGCNNSTSSEPGVVFDEITALGELLRSGPSLLNPGGVYNVKHVFLSSYSESSQILLTYNIAFGAQNPTLWDAYMQSSGGYGYLLNACQNPGLLLLHGTTGPSSTTAPVFQTQTISETEAQSGGVPRSSDSDSATNRYRYYDLSGSSHINNDLVNAQASDADLAAAGAIDVTQGLVTSACADPGPISNFPNRFVYDALWDNLEKWVVAGTVPPHAAPQNVSQSQSSGLQVGGVRSPGVDAPLYYYYGGKQVSGPNSTLCSLTGYQVPLTQAQFNSAYGSTNGYNQRVILSANRNAAARFLTPADKSTILANPIVSSGN